jgi:NAD(P)-dependent dehydrogenase (short-subunit alcohol dehydrogenase family)
MTIEPTKFLGGKTALVTGAGRGIGRAIAHRLGIVGANVAVTSRTSDQLEQTRRLIEMEGARSLAIPADVSQVADVERVIAETESLFGGVDILVNNAGTAPLATIDQMEPDVFDRIIATNVRTVYLCSRGVWPLMQERGGGAIVNISSISAYDPFPGFAAYGAAKAFVVAFTNSLAVEGKEHGIRVYGVAPGAVETQMLRSAFPTFPDDKVLEPDDVAALVVTMLSPACRYSSGQTIIIRKD